MQLRAAVPGTSAASFLSALDGEPLEDEFLRLDWRYWVSPLPPPGPLAFVCAWPAFGIAESRAELEAAQILAAARNCIDLWPGS
ncbi:MAG: hypothetical protein ACRDPO_29200 [Streptosporangiaceae bacterium]